MTEKVILVVTGTLMTLMVLVFFVPIFMFILPMFIPVIVLIGVLGLLVYALTVIIVAAVRKKPDALSKLVASLRNVKMVLLTIAIVMTLLQPANFDQGLGVVHDWVTASVWSSKAAPSFVQPAPQAAAILRQELGMELAPVFGFVIDPPWYGNYKLELVLNTSPIFGEYLALTPIAICAADGTSYPVTPYYKASGLKFDFGRALVLWTIEPVAPALQNLGRVNLCQKMLAQSNIQPADTCCDEINVAFFTTTTNRLLSYHLISYPSIVE